MLFEAIMDLPSSLQNQLCKFILVAFFSNIAASNLLQKKYRTWVKIGVALVLLTLLYAIGRLLGYLLRHVSNKNWYKRPMAFADVNNLSSASPDRRASLHVTRRASAAQALEALQQVTEVVAQLETKEKFNFDNYCSDDDYCASSYYSTSNTTGNDEERGSSSCTTYVSGSSVSES
jgi:hypothetical protein